MDSWTRAQGLADGVGDSFDLRPAVHNCFVNQLSTKTWAVPNLDSLDWISICCGSSSTCHLAPLDIENLIDSTSTPPDFCRSVIMQANLHCSVSVPMRVEQDTPLPDIVSDGPPRNPEEFFEDVKRTFAHLVDGLGDLEWNKLPEIVKEHIKNNPKMTAFQVITLLVPLGAPGLVWGPLFKGLGMATVGPTAGSVVAWFQAAVGTPLPFRVAQSAAMGGSWGIPIANGAVRLGSLIGNGVVGMLQKSSDEEQKEDEGGRSKMEQEL